MAFPMDSTDPFIINRTHQSLPLFGIRRRIPDMRSGSKVRPERCIFPEFSPHGQWAAEAGASS